MKKERSECIRVFSNKTLLYPQSRFFGKILFSFAVLCTAAVPNFVLAEEAGSLSEALSKGKVSLDMSYRYESVDQDNISKEAHASTLRSRLGYKTAAFKGVSGFLEFEDVSVIGNEQYNSSANGKTQYPIVADPEDTEINQAYLQFTGVEGLILTGGRQRIKLDNDRFIGNVGWRQNEQTFDAIRLAVSPIAGLTGTYIYIENVNRVFGTHHPSKAGTSLSAPSANLLMSSHVIHAAYTNMPMLNVSLYGYLLDFDDVPAASNKTLGLRLTGAVPVGGDMKLLYTAEYADQSDYADGASSIDADYSLFELGTSAKGATMKFSREVLGGEGVYAFATPLATLHAFQGWADKFLVTPVNGIEDLSATLSGEVFGIKLVAVYHIFTSDSANVDYGTELDVLATKKLTDNTLVGVKYASYDADSDPKNTGGTAVDTDKLWLLAELKF